MDDSKIIIEAKEKNLVVVNIITFILAIIIIFSMLKLRDSFSKNYFIFATFLVMLYLIFDYYIWKIKGIRKVEIDEEKIIFYRGKNLNSFVLNKNDIKEIDIFSKFKGSRYIINFVYGNGKIIRVGNNMTFFSGDRVRLVEDAFGEKEFKEFMLYLIKNYKDKIINYKCISDLEE
ncbi:MAG: hypothetical protein N3A58_02155 [Spirochaetes bacterium]|nr:hypothetical protein [Spirochaetota bacterium]